MKALILILLNTANQTYHPIWYMERPFAGEGLDTVIRYRSKGHHTTGFKSREEAVKSANDLAIQLKNAESLFISAVTVEVDADLEWDGADIPADTQLRSA